MLKHCKCTLTNLNGDQCISHTAALYDALLPRAHAQGVKQSVLSVICRRLSAQKSSDLVILASEQPVSTTKQSKTGKNLLVFASNRIARLISATNRVFYVGHAYQPHL